MPIPLIAYAAVAAVGAYLFLRKKPSSEMTIDAFAAQQNAETNRINAENAALRAKGIVALGEGPRAVDASTLLRTRNGVVFSTVSPAGFLGQIARDTLGNTLEPGDLVTVDVTAAGIHVPEVPVGNMAFKVVNSVAMGPTAINLTVIDPRLPATTAVVSLPQAAITDAVGRDSDMTHVILGMGGQ
jgi:hypothetical protein